MKGLETIMQKLMSLPALRFQVSTFDAQPSTNDGILCMIGGNMFIDGGDNPVKFAQTFHLQKGGKLEYYCLNDVFRLNYG